MYLYSVMFMLDSLHFTLIFSKIQY